ncbi:hypothetical protein SCUCBS95973_000062 [Sporothrix curviconia]|uniref:Uncharacterized protein n=1 Tax=Sporothrix curviconia TaxID=1260050 RepID=A0ABP0AKF2_9PEZI
MSSAAGAAFSTPVPPQAVDASVAASPSTFAFWFGIARSSGSMLVTLVAGSFKGIVQAGGYLVRVLAWLLASLYAIVAWPVAQVYAMLRFLLSPVIYTLSYLFAPLVSFFYFLGRLRLGSAAFVGIVTGLVLKFASSYFFVVLSLDEKARAAAAAEEGEGEEELESEDSREESLQRSQQLKKTGRQMRSVRRPALLPPRPAARPASVEGPVVAVKTEDAILSPQDDVWQWLEEYNPKQPNVAMEPDGGDAAALLKKPGSQPGGLLALTIMEESSSE